MRTFILAIPILLLSGCLYRGEARTVDEAELRQMRDVTQIRVPVVRQVGEKDCGAAAVASILSFWGRTTNADDVRRATGTPKEEAIAAGALQRYLAERGFESFLFEGKLADLRRELDRGRPVLVGMLKPYVGDKWFAHYEVVTGIGTEHVYTMNPARGIEQYPIPGFIREWQGAERLTLVIAPGQQVSTGLSGARTQERRLTCEAAAGADQLRPRAPLIWG